MALRFEMLGSGSAGNCGLIKTKSSTLLVDAGFSCKRIKDMLASRNATPEQIDAVFITHEHHDHIQGLRGLRNYKNIKFFANIHTAATIESKFNFGISWNSFATGNLITFNGINVRSFSVPHDAVDPIGYIFSVSQEADGHIKSIAWMTDLGYIPSHVINNVSEVDMLIIEANYDNDLLTKDIKRPPYIKARIRSRLGHLPNEAAISFVKDNQKSKWKKVIFAHVSADCNHEQSIRKLLGDPAELKFEVDIALPQICLPK